MECPSCNNSVELTWKKYVSNPFSRFTCEICAAKYKFSRPVTWYIWFVLWLVGYSFTFDVSLELIGYTYFWEVFSGVSVIMFTLYFSIDRMLESKYNTVLR